MMKKTQDLKTEFNKVKALKRAQAEMNVELENPISHIEKTEDARPW